MGWGVGIMGMWEFGGICELLFKLLFKLPKVGVGAFVFAPNMPNGMPSNMYTHIIKVALATLPRSGRVSYLG